MHIFSSVIAYVAPKAHSLKTGKSALEWDMLDLLKEPKANGSATEQYRWHENKTCMHSLVPTSSIASYKSDEPTIATTPLQYFLYRQHHLPQLEAKLAGEAICVLCDEIVS